MRDDFDKETKETLARRVSFLCSNPKCNKPTSGPQTDPYKAINLGVAAHITAASPGGARYDMSLSPEHRKSIDNGIWLCQNCAKLVDNDEHRYTINCLRTWKVRAEKKALLELENPSRRLSGQSLIIYKHIKSFITFVVGLIGAVITTYTFFQLWRGDSWIITILASLFGLVLLLSTLFYFAISKDLSSISPFQKVQTFPQLYKPARITLLIVLLMTPAAYIVLYKKHLNLQDKTVIMITNFYTLKPEKYPVTEELLSQLGQALSDSDDTIILPSDCTVTEQQGKETARALGMRYRADLVLWGWYDTTDTDVKITVHIENLTESEWLPLPRTKTYPIQAAIADLNHFQFQERFSKEMSALILFVSALARHEAKDFEGAKDRLSTAIELDKWPHVLIPKEVLFFKRAEVYIHLADYNQALDDFSEAIVINPKFAEAYNNRASAYEHLKDFKRALDDSSKAIEINPRLGQAYNNRGIAYSELKEAEKAVEDFTKASELNPERSEPYHNLGHIYMETNQIKEAINNFTEALRITPDNAKLYADRAGAYTKANNSEEAIANYSEAINRDPSLADAYTERGHVYAVSGKTRKALADYMQAIKINPKLGEAYNHIGLLYHDQGEYQTAIDYYSQAVQADPIPADAYFNRAQAYLKMRKPQEAINDFSADIIVHPDHADAIHFRGDAYANLGKLQEAIADWCRALQIAKDISIREAIEKDLLLVGAQCVRNN